MRTIIECVPNVSEGRDRAAIDAMASAVRSAPGVRLLDVSSDGSHNRSVLTFVGDAPAVKAAVLALFREAVARIDLRDASRRAPADGSRGRRPVHPGAGQLGRRVRRAVPRRRRGDRVRVRRAGLPLRRVGVRGAPPQPRRGAEGPVRGIRREDEGSPLGTRLRPGGSALDRGRGRRRRAALPHRLQHQPRNAGPVDRRPDRQGDPPPLRRLPLREGDGCRARRPRDRPGLDQHDELPQDAAASRLRVRALRSGATRGARSSARRSWASTPADALYAAAEHYLRLERFTPEQVLETKLLEE